MAINVYSGLQGSGKSYEVVSEVIVPQIVLGRRVVTNVDGVSEDAIKNYCFDVLGVTADLGEVLHVTNDDVLRDDFFPMEEEGSATICKRGDLIAIDEGWRFWSQTERITKAHMTFFRMHRHYADATGQTCDLVVMTQDIQDLHRSLRRVVELSFRFKKHKWAGSTSRYVVNMYEGANQGPRVRPQSIIQKKYNPAIFPLYQSYAGGAGRETQVDKRQNVFGSAKVMVMGFGVVLMLAVGVWGMLRAVAPRGRFSANAATRPASVEGVASADGSAPRAAVQSVSGRPAVAPPPPLPPISDNWRLAGFQQLVGRRVVVVADPVGRLRYEDASAFTWADGVPVAGVIDGQRVTVFSGRAPSEGGGGGASSFLTPTATGAGSPLAGAARSFGVKAAAP